MSESYQLTRFPIGSKREFWAMSWPLMIGLLSSSLMIFVDRLFLARYHPQALNAVVTSSLAYYMFIVIPLAIVEIAEVVTGRLHGEERHKEIGSAVWQMVLLSIFLVPIFLIIAYFAPSLLFHGSIAIDYETPFFQILVLSAPILCIVIALNGFFIGIGKVKFVTMAAIFANICNIILSYLLIFGAGPIPPLGIVGAAMATSIAQLLQLLFLLAAYWSHYYRKTYGTTSLGFDRSFMQEGLRIGVPSGLARCVEIIAHFIFFRVAMTVGVEQMTLLAITQSVYILFTFVIDAQSKSASAIVSNLLGANEHAPIGRVMRSAMSLQSLYFVMLLTIVWLFSDQIYNIFSAHGDAAIPATPELLSTFRWLLCIVSLFFLIDGSAWIMVGFLTAAKDTRFIFWVSLVINWIGYVPPTVILIGWLKGGAIVSWSIIVAVALTSLVIYLWRYSSGRWLAYDTRREVL